ncbi:beta-prism lectin domain-containing protein [Vibrio lentus]|uniref:beta-prism lectin domain-containing protein n=1 Tax=Vibrio lentus TaxID=136468 RepID=UPI00178CF061|nr:beta-prism lectin domain-containing protein [Vibrio lentus]MDN3632978.1 beta-prism lectin domain-containing protein [Vibrio lentus]
MVIEHRFIIGTKTFLGLLGIFFGVFSTISSAFQPTNERFSHYEFGRTDAKYAVNIEMSKLNELSIRHGAAIDGFVYTYDSEETIYRIGGEGGIISSLDTVGLNKMVIYSGNFYWGSAEKPSIVKIEFHYNNGDNISFGRSDSASNIVKSEHEIQPDLISISLWSDGWLLEGLRFNYPRLESASPSGEFSENLPQLDIKRAVLQTGNGFLYTVMPTSKRIGLLTYDGTTTIDVSTLDLDYDQLTILECGSRDDFVPRAAVRNYENVFGVTGYENIDSYCHLAKNKEVKWFDGGSFGFDSWYSDNLKGDAQCYSLDGQRCLTRLDYTQQHEITNPFILQDMGTNANRVAGYLSNTNQLILKFDGNPQGTGTFASLVLPEALEQTMVYPLSNISPSHIHALASNGVAHFIPPGASVGETYTHRSPIEQTKRVIVDVVNTDSQVTVYLPNGQAHQLSTGERKTWTYLGGEWFEEGRNLNDYPDIIRRARPVTCGQALAQTTGHNGSEMPGHWCAKLASVEKTFSHQTVQANIDATMINMETLFSQMEVYETKKVNDDFRPRILSLQNRVKKKRSRKNSDCKLAWLLPMAILCIVSNEQLDDLRDALDDLNKEYDAELKSTRDNIQLARESRWHKLHETWAENDPTHFSGLLKEESQTLDALKNLKAGYEKSAQQAKADYQTAMQKYLTDASPEHILLETVEHLPLVGPEIKHIVDYARHPTGKNLRRMLLGLAGPVGEAVEGVVELVTEPGALNQKEIKFLTDVLTDLGNDSTIGQGLQDVVSDAINDLGDEVIESIRQAGLWRDNPGERNLIQSDYQNFVDWRSQAERIDYDFWQGASDQEINVQQNFTPENRNFTSFLATPSRFDHGSLTEIKYASGGSIFATKLATIFNHSFGKGYEEVAKSNPLYASWTREQVTNELYKVLADPAYHQQRQPYWVDSAAIGKRPAGLVFTKQHAMIVINSDLVSRDSEDFYKFYFEELGHLVNWWRCKIFDVNVSQCDSMGDAGARFRDAVLIDPALHTVSLPSLLAELPQHPNVDKQTMQFADNSFATLEGWPDYYTVNDHIGGGGKFSWLLRLGLDVTSQELRGLVDVFELEVVINAPSPALKGNPWKKSANGYCQTDTDTDCNMPTMWMSIAFRDALKVVSGSMPQFKDAKASQAGFDLLPMLVRKHGGKLPFQLTSVNSTDWRYMGSHDIYYKKFTGSLVARLNLWKTQKLMRGKTAGTTFKPEISLKAAPASGSYVVEIATKDKDDFAAWLAGDIVSAVAGCAVGFAVGVIAETDPVALCHVMSDITEAVETAFQGLDKRPTMFFEADGNINLPVSLEYRYATSGDKIRRRTATEAPSGRVQYSEDGRAHYLVGEAPGSIPEEDISHNRVSITTNPQASSFRTKAGKAFSKLGAKSINPVGVFRFRVGFDYAEKVIQKGAYALPSAVIED